MKLRDVDGPWVGEEVLAQSRVADALDPVAERRDRTVCHRVAEDLDEADLTAVVGLELNPDHPRREHRTLAQTGSALDLHMPVAWRESPARRLRFADHQAVTERLLSACAAHRPRPRAGLHRRDAQRLLMKIGTPERLLGRDGQPQPLRDQLVCGRRLARRTPRRKVGGRPDRLIELPTRKPLLDGRRSQHRATLRTGVRRRTHPVGERPISVRSARPRGGGGAAPPAARRGAPSRRCRGG
jgi:hypothetical protein